MIRMIYLMAILVVMVMLVAGTTTAKRAKMNENLNRFQVEFEERLAKCEYNCEQ